MPALRYRDEVRLLRGQLAGFEKRSIRTTDDAENVYAEFERAYKASLNNPIFLSLHDARPTDIGPYAPEEMRGTRPAECRGAYATCRIRFEARCIRSGSARTWRFRSRTPQARTSSS